MGFCDPFNLGGIRLARVAGDAFARRRGLRALYSLAAHHELDAVVPEAYGK